MQNIYEVENTIRRIVPGAKTVVGHGQMDGPKLEKIMLDFINGEQDVLIATTIIESGLDIPNANTIIVNHAENFGLSDLHQLRGRVGRSNKKAFCYLLTPPLSLVSTEARRRLQAIEEFSDLGSGFNIAMRDLDIRGAGDLLGAEQSGFIADIGYETYHRILNEAIQELKHDEYNRITSYNVCYTKLLRILVLVLLQLLNGFVQDAMIGLVTNVGNKSTLLGPQQIARPTYIEVAHGNIKAASQVGELLNGLQAATRLGAHQRQGRGQ